MTPNLRFNKTMTKHLLKSIPPQECKISSLTSIEWGLENSNTVYGSYHKTLFKTLMFLLQKIDDKYRLITSDDSGICNFYIIDDINRYIDYIGVEKLDLVDLDLARAAIDEAAELPNTGIIMIDEKDNIFVYDHKNY